MNNKLSSEVDLSLLNIFTQENESYAFGSDENHARLCKEDVMALIAATSTITLILRKLLHSYTDEEGRPLLRRAARRSSKPAVSVGDSVNREYLICFEDGARVKSLRTHLRRLGITPEEYREKWELPPDYPMVAQALSEKRAAIARAHKPHLSRRSRRTGGDQGALRRG